MTLVVLALDALDHTLVETYDCDYLRLENADPLDTFAYGVDLPYTPEVWATVATGVHPRTHGITKSGVSEWDNPFVSVVSRLLDPLPASYRSRLGDVAETAFGAEWEMGETDEPSFFDGPHRVVHNWPGVHRSSVLRERWRTLLDAAHETERPRASFDRDVLAGGAEKFGWVREMLNHDVELVGTHVHVVDLAGHAYGAHEDHYRTFYEWMDDRISEVLAEMADDDDLLVLSDHGMGVEWIDGDEPGVHSWRATVSSTISGPLPDSVFDVQEWVEEHVEPVEPTEQSGKMDIDTEHLADLGYM